MSKTFAKALALAATLAIPFTALTPAHAATPVTIKIATYGNVIEDQKKWSAITEYKKIHPEVTIKLVKSDLDPHHANLRNQFMSKKTADIVAIEVSYSGYFRTVPQYFEDLSQAPYNANSIKSQFLDWRWAQGIGYNNAVIGIPTDVGGMQVAYRTDLFKAHGLPTDRVAVGKLWPTWDKFIETANKYSSKLSSAEKTSCKVKKVCYGFLDNGATLYSAILNQADSKYYENDGTKEGKLIYSTNPAVKSAFTTTSKALAANVGVNIAPYTNDWAAGMNKGTFAAILAPAWMMDYIKQQAPKTSGKWDIAALPGGGGNLGGSQLTIPKAAVHKKEAWDFIQWYLAPKQQLTVFKYFGLFPSASSLYTNASLTGYKDKFFNNAPVGKIYAEGAVKLKPIYEGRLQRSIDNIIGQALSRVGLKKQTSAAAWKQAMAEVKNLTGK